MAITKNFIKKYKIPIKFESNLHESPRWSKYNVDNKNKTVLAVNRLFLDYKNQSSNSYILQSKMSIFKQTLLTNKQLRVYFGFVKNTVFTKIKKLAKDSKGKIHTNLLILLECRLQTIIYRMSFSKTILEARQLIAHGHICINGNVITSSDYQTKIGDIVSITQKKKSVDRVLNAVHMHEIFYNEYLMRTNEKKPFVSSWHYKKCFSYPLHFEIDYKTLIGVVIAKPEIHNMKYPTLFFLSILIHNNFFADMVKLVNTLDLGSKC